MSPPAPSAPASSTPSGGSHKRRTGSVLQRDRPQTPQALRGPWPGSDQQQRGAQVCAAREPRGGSRARRGRGNLRPERPVPTCGRPGERRGRPAHMMDTGTHRTGGVDASRAALSAPAGRSSRLAHTPLAGPRSPSGPATPAVAHLLARSHQPAYSPTPVPTPSRLPAHSPTSAPLTIPHLTMKRSERTMPCTPKR